MDILDKFFEMRKVSEGTDKMILILVKPEYVEEISNRFEMAKVSVSGEPGFIFSEADVRRLDREYNGDLIDLMFYAPEWRSVSDIRDFIDKDDLEPIHDWSYILEESKITEGVGDLPAGYTDEDLAEFLDKEEKNPMPTFDDDDYYDPNDEVIQFVYTKSGTDVQSKIDNTFEGGYIEDSSMATIGEFRKFTMDNELDVEDFRIFDTKGNEYFDKLALVYDIAPDLQNMPESCETPGYEHCCNCGADLDNSNYGGELGGDKFCDSCYEHEVQKWEESLETVLNHRMTESIIAGPNGITYSNEKRTAKHDAADNLLRKIGKLPENVEEPHKLNETYIAGANGIVQSSDKYVSDAKEAAADALLKKITKTE